MSCSALQVLSLLMAPVADHIWLIDYVWRQYQVRLEALWPCPKTLPRLLRAAAPTMQHKFSAYLLRSAGEHDAGHTGEPRTVLSTGGARVGRSDDVHVPRLLEQSPVGQGHLPHRVAIGAG